MDANTILDNVEHVWKTIPFSTATWLLFAVLVLIIRLFMLAHKDPNSPINWQDLILTRDSTGELRTDPYRVGFLVGVLFGSWAIVTLTDSGRLTFDIFGVYLAFLLGGTGWMSSVKNVGTGPTLPQVQQNIPPPPSKA